MRDVALISSVLLPAISSPERNLGPKRKISQAPALISLEPDSFEMTKVTIPWVSPLFEMTHDLERADLAPTVV